MTMPTGYNASTKLSAKYWPSDILFVGNINKYVIIMHLICINHNNILNKPFFRKKEEGRNNTLYMCLDIHAKFRGDRPLRGRNLKGGQIDPPPPPVKTCSQKAQLK